MIMMNASPYTPSPNLIMGADQYAKAGVTTILALLHLRQAANFFEYNIFFICRTERQRKQQKWQT